MPGAGDPSMNLSDRIRVIERGWLSSNQVVCFDDDGGATVVDTGYVSEGDETLRLVDEALRGRPLRRIVNTHLHSDHAGGNALLKARHGCAIWIPSGESGLVERWDEARLSYQATSQRCPRFMHDAVFQRNAALEMGGEDWTALPAAGHDNAMVMFWCERLGVLMSADALWRKGFGVIFPELAGESGFAEQHATLELIGQLKPGLVIPGHGAPFTDVDAALQAARSRLQWLAEEPRRNTENALKVLLAFKLLEERRMDMAALAEVVRASLAHNPGMRAHLSAFLPEGMPVDHEALADLAARQLVDAGAARLEGGWLVAR